MSLSLYFFFFNDTATTEIYTLSLHDALPICEISMKDVFRSGDSSKKFKIAEGQWYRYAPSYVSPAYHLLEGFPFIQEPPSGDLQERVQRRITIPLTLSNLKLLRQIGRAVQQE